MEDRESLQAGCFLVGVPALMALVVFFFVSALVTVDAGESCAVTTWGQLTGQAGPGLHFRWPVAQQYHCFSSRPVVYETSEFPEESNADYPDFQVDAQTSDGQQIKVRFGVRYFVPQDKVGSVYRDVGRDMGEVNERVVKFHSRALVRLEMQKHEANRLYTGDVFAVVEALEDQLREVYSRKDVELESFVIRKIAFDPDYVQAIEDKQIEFERIVTAQYQAEQAINEANREETLADGRRRADIKRAQGRAEAIRLEGEALRQYPEVLQLEFVKRMENVKWGFLPSEGITPFVPLPTD